MKFCRFLRILFQKIQKIEKIIRKNLRVFFGFFLFFVPYLHKIGILTKKKFKRILSLHTFLLRYRDENELLKIFANYTRNACRFECMLERAHESCGCTPWNFPYIGKGEMEICDMFGSTCFYDLMSDIGYGEQCACEEDCDEVSFTKFETNKNLNADELCTDTNSWVYKYMQTVKRNVEGYDYRYSSHTLFEIFLFCPKIQL